MMREGGLGLVHINNNVYKMTKEHNYYIYILSNKRNGVLYIGVTNSLLRRTFQHKTKEDKNSFTAKYKTDKLVYYENYKYIEDALSREKELKKWNRSWKIKLIEKDNPTWRDMFRDMD
jgi:putative endonuclease